MKRLFTTLLVFTSIHLFASDWTFTPDSAFKHSISLSGDYYFSSKAITNRFAVAFFRGEFITNEMKNTVSYNLLDLNKFGGAIKGELSYTSKNDTIFRLPNSFFTVSLSNNYQTYSKFKRDAFELFFKGNKAYAGQTADVGDFKYKQILYQQVKFVFGHKYRREKNYFEYSAGLSLNKGQQLNEISAPRATIFTEEYGEYLDVDAELHVLRSDSAKSNFNAWNGTGGSAFFSFRWKDKKNNILNFSIDNFGFINWNNKTTSLTADTAFRFQGVDVSELFQFSDSLKTTISLDSSLVEPYIATREKKTYFSKMPSKISISYRYILSPGKLDIEAGINYMLFAEYTHQETGVLSYTIKNTHRISLLASYGGYAGFEAGLAYKVFFLKRWMLTLQSDYLSDILDPDKGCAQGAFVSLTAYF